MLHWLWLAACTPGTTDDTDALGETGTTDTDSTPGTTTTGHELWESPGAPGTASAVAADAVAWCRGNWQPDAQIVRFDRVPGVGDGVFLFSETDGENLCTYLVVPGIADPLTDVGGIAFYAPGYSYEHTDRLRGWAVDSDEAAAAFGFSADDDVIVYINPASHRQQISGSTYDLSGYDDDHPMILVTDGSTGGLVDGRTGAIIP
ncbi:MAG: hypothetical protein KC621_13410 [Myxococcales bacterium]|nr:hypothetical protein [Myxococcales bacterium]